MQLLLDAFEYLPERDHSTALIGPNRECRPRLAAAAWAKYSWSVEKEYRYEQKCNGGLIHSFKSLTSFVSGCFFSDSGMSIRKM